MRGHKGKYEGYTISPSDESLETMSAQDLDPVQFWGSFISQRKPVSHWGGEILHDQEIIATHIKLI